MYASRSDLIERFGAVSIDNLERMVTPDKLPDAAVSVLALADATEEADSYIGARYALPLAAVPEALRRTVCDIARYRLHKDKPTEEVRTRYDDGISWLKAVAAGKAFLKLPPPSIGQPSDDPANNGRRVAVGVSHFGGVFGAETTDKMPRL